MRMLASRCGGAASTPSGPPFLLSGFFCNIQGGLTPSGTDNNLVKDKLGHICDVLEDGHVFAAISEAGLRSDVVPPSIGAVLRERGFSMVCHCPKGNHKPGEPGKGAASVAIILAKGWQFAKVFRVDSNDRQAGCIGAEITDGQHTAFVASFKMPPGLDGSCSNWSSSPAQQCVRRLILCALQWAAPYPIAFLGGDFNTTATCLDRVPRTCPADCRKARSGNPVSEVMLAPAHGMVDAFRELHPADPGLTFAKQAGVHLSRLDYVFVPKELLAFSLKCQVEREVFPPGPPRWSDHDPVFVSVALSAGSPRRAPPRPAPRILAAQASLAQKSAFAVATEAAVTALRLGWRGAPVSAEELCGRQTSVARTIVECARSHLPSSGRRWVRPQKSRARPCRRIRTTVAVLSRLRTYALAFRESPHGVYSPRFLLARSRARAIGVDPVAEPMDPAAWVEWALDSGKAAVRDAEQALRAVNAGNPLRGDRALSEHLWRNASCRRRFFAAYFRAAPARATALGSVVDPESGLRTTNPERAKEIVAAAVAVPFVTAVQTGPSSGGPPVPAPCLGNCSCDCRSCDRSAGPVTQPSEVACSDPRCSPTPPALWSALYRVGVQVCPTQSDEDFARIGADVSPDMVSECVRGCDRATAGGHDELSMGILKLAMDVRLQRPEPVDCQSVKTPVGLHASSAVAIAELSTWAFRLGVQTAHVSKGHITLIPKGSASTAVEDSRPITLLSEIGKIPARILAARIQAVLAAKPELLHVGQRAFLANGDVSQCINTVVDVLEDFNQHKRRAGGVLHAVSYDQRKAYDSVQRTSIQATLDRFRFPRSIRDYICSGLDSAVSAVKTDLGLTDEFAVRSSVRQGDPLSPLVYILFLDALHRGFESDPSGPVPGSGYTMSGGSVGGELRVASCGFADDLITFAESAVAAERMHLWARQFFGMHAAKINAEKTKYFCSDAPGPTRSSDASIKRRSPVARLLSICGRSTIPVRPPSESFRYLGVRVNVNLNWKEEMSRLERIVWRGSAALLNHRMKLAPAVDAIRSFVIPAMEAGLQVIRLSKSALDRLDVWTGRLQAAAMRAQAGNSLHSSRLGFCSVTGVPSLSHLARGLRATHLYQRLCLGSNVLPGTSRSRLSAARGSLEAALAGDHVLSTEECSGDVGRWNRAAFALWGPFRLPVRLELNHQFVEPSSPLPCVAGPAGPSALSEVRTVWDPRSPPDSLFMTPGARKFVVFTDGSTPREGTGVSGYSAIVFDQSNLAAPPVALGSWLRCSGNNFLAEMCAILAGLLAVPAQAQVCVFTDSQACIDAIARNDGAEKRRLRSAARAMLTSVRRVMRSRSGAVSFHHVRAHTGGLDFASQANELADARANSEREAAAGEVGRPFLFNEERVIAFMRWPDRGREEHVVGDVGAACREWVRRSVFKEWSAQPRQGRVAALVGYSEVRELCKGVLASRDSARLHTLVLALCEWLPVGRQVGRRANEAMRAALQNQWTCPSCPAVGDETSAHRLLCPSGRLIREQLGARLDRTVTFFAGVPDVSDRLFTRPVEELARDVCEASHRLYCPQTGSSRGLPDLARDLVSRAAGEGQEWSALPLALAVAAAVRNVCCPCGSRARLGHGDCAPAITPDLASRLRRAFALDTNLFCSPAHIVPGFCSWGCFDSRAREVGSAGNPWKLPWAGRFSLAAPWLPDGATLAGRCIRRAAAAVRSPRPTRILLVLRHPDERLLARYGAQCVASCSSDRAVSIFLLQNTAAAALHSVEWAELQGTGFLCAVSPTAPACPAPAGIAIRGFRAGFSADAALIGCGALPFVTASAPVPPVRLPASLADAFRSLAVHDRYAGLIGLLPRHYGSLLAWVFREAGLSSRVAEESALRCAERLRAALLDAACRVIARGRAASSAWRESLDGRNREVLEDVLAQRAHERERRRQERAFELSAARRRERNLLRERRKHVFSELALPSLREFLRLFPGWTIASAPREHRALVESMPLRVRWTRAPGTGRLRPNSRTHQFHDEYVLDFSERRALARRRLCARLLPSIRG